MISTKEVKRVLGIAAIFTGLWLNAAVTLKCVSDKTDRIYRCGEKAKLTLTVLGDDQKLLKTGSLTLNTYDDNMKNRIGKAVFPLAEGNPVTVECTLDHPGFLLLNCGYAANPKHWKRIRFLSVAFEPEKITAGAKRPDDFMSFWRNAIALAEKTPLGVELEPLPSFTKAGKYAAFKVSWNAPFGRLYGFLSIPEKPKPLPAEVTVCWAGPGFTQPVISSDNVVLSLNIHNYDPANAAEAYKKMNEGELCNTEISTKYMYMGLEDREKLYFYHGIVGCVRAVKWLASLPEVDSKRIGYFGISQGGGFGLILGGLCDNFKTIVVAVPALCDQQAQKQNRYPGWPFFSFTKEKFVKAADVQKIIPYYDAAFFAESIKCPVYFTVGWVDHICPPATVYAAYNAIHAPKQMINDPEKGHEAKAGYEEHLKTMREKLRE